MSLQASKPRTIHDFLTNGLNDLNKKGLLNTIDTLEKENAALIQMNGRQLINMASNNYLGFATHPELKKACIQATEEYGVGAGAVRTINGTMDIHIALEKKIAEFKGTEDAIAFQSGFNCNMGAIAAIMKKGDAILSDELNHASIIDGCRLSGADIIRLKHADIADLEAKAKEATQNGKYNKVMYITDGVFSMDGDVAKIPEIVEVCQKYNVITYVDDAHGSGVMGKGAGTVKHFGLQNHIDFQMGTLSKAIGVVGGYIAGTKDLITWLKSQARPFLFSTSLTPGSAAACKRAIELMQQHPEYVDKLWENANYFKTELRSRGYNLGKSETPITPVILGDENKTQQFSRRLIEEGVYVKPIVFPTVPVGTGRVRNMPTSMHTKEQLDKVVTIYTKVGKELNLI